MRSDTLTSTLRGRYAQFERLIKLDTPAGRDRLVPLWVKGSARLGRDYEFIVEAAALRDGPEIEARSLLGQAVTLWIGQTDHSYIPIHGYVHHFAELGADGSCIYYQFRFSSWLYFLRLRRDQRDWQEKSGEQIMADVFGAHRQASAQTSYRFDLREPMPSYSYRMQWESDLNFVYRSMEEAGVFGRFEFADDGSSHTLVIMDDAFRLPPLKKEVVRMSRAGEGEEFDGFVSLRERVQLQSARLTANTFDYKQPSLDKSVVGATAAPDGLPADGEVYDYTGAYTWATRQDGERHVRARVEAWESQIQRFDAVGALRCAMPGHWFKLARGALHDSSSSDDEYLMLGVDWSIGNNVPGLDGYPALEGSLRDELATRGATRGGSVVKHMDGAEGFFQVKVELQRRHTPFRLPREHAKPPMSLMNATVVAIPGEEVFTDQLNRARVHFPWYRDTQASCWVRAAFADAGAQRGAVHPLRDGDAVLVDFVGGDCDRPVIVSRVAGGETEPVWHTYGLLSGYRSKEYGGSGYNQLVLDDSTRQNRVHLYSSSYRTHLHLGYLIEHENNTRGGYLGSGFDLKSDAYGALRAARGLVVSTHPTSAAQPLDVTAAGEQLASARQVADLASQASETNHAESLEEGLHALDRFAQATRYSSAGGSAGGRTAGGGTGTANSFATPVMLLASPAGMGLSTQDSLQATANQQVNVVSGQSTHVAAGKSFLVSAMEKLSLFVQNAGMKLFAAKGKVEIQAQSDAMALSALKDVTITSTDGRLVLSAEKEIWIGAGGSYIRITPDLIENGTPGKILEKCASWDKPGAASMRVPAGLSSTAKSCAWKMSGAAADSASIVELG
jgi:type VI secretion system secreted protein VgrG